MGALELIVVCSLLSRDDPQEPDVRISTQAWYSVPYGWLYITRGSRPGTATPADFGSDVSLDPDVAPLLEARMRVSGPHGVGVRFAQIDAEGTGSADESFTYHGNAFDAGPVVKTALGLLPREG